MPDDFPSGEPIPERWDDGTSPGQLTSTLNAQRWGHAQNLVDLLVDDLKTTNRRMPDEPALATLRALKSAAWFPRLRELGDALIDSGQTTHDVQILLAQAEIEHDEITRAIGRLSDLEAEVETRLETAVSLEKAALEGQLSETMGLLGRAYKQLYINAGPTRAEPRRHDFERATALYGEAYRSAIGDFLWHGVNLVALETHAERIACGNPRVFSDSARRLAGEILEHLRMKPERELTVWDWANAADAHLARGEFPQASDAIQRYLSGDDIDAFAVQSTLRQMRELWMLEPSTPPGDTILLLLTSRLAELSGQLSGTDAIVPLHPEERPVYERVLGKTGFRPLQWLKDAVDRAAGVVLLGPEPLNGIGTGFVIDGAWLGAPFAGRALVMTNAHVCTNDPVTRRQHPDSFLPMELTVSFLGLGTDPKHMRFRDEVVWSSPPGIGLDASIVELDGPIPDEVSTPVRRGADLSPGDRAYLIGYPGGVASTQVSLQDNEVKHLEEPYVRYRTPTEGGSSGSPVFDERWRLAGLHHAYSSRHELNEGVSMEVILGTAERDLRASSST